MLMITQSVQIIIFIIIGCSLGILTGLIPGVHINLISLILIFAVPIISRYINIIFVVVIIISMAITHTFLDFIPSIFLGAPNEDTALSVLPAHKLLLQGKGYLAVMLTLFGSLMSLIITICLFPLFIYIFPKLYSILKPLIAYILIFVVIFLILNERKRKKIFWATIVFLLSGIFGYLVINSTIRNPLFPLFTGLFGISTLFLSIATNTKIPKQEIEKQFDLPKNTFKSLITSVFSGSFVSFFPGIGASQAAVIGTTIIKEKDIKPYLILVGGINTVNFLVSIIGLYTINKARNGAILAISRLINITSNNIPLFISTALISGMIATFLTMFFSKRFSRFIEKINYKKLCISIIILVVLISVVLSGAISLIILFISTFIGLLPPLLKIKRSHLMGCLLLPVILWFI